MRLTTHTVWLLLSFALGCGTTPIPPPPASFDTVVVTSSLSADALYADGLAAFIRAGWEPMTPTEEGLVISIRPDGMSADSTAILVTLRAQPLGTDSEAPSPGLTDPDYGVPDLARGDVVEDVSREQYDPDSLYAAADPPAITQGDAVLTATVDASQPGARRVLIRTAKILAAVSGALSYR